MKKVKIMWTKIKIKDTVSGFRRRRQERGKRKREC